MPREGGSFLSLKVCNCVKVSLKGSDFTAPRTWRSEDPEEEPVMPGEPAWLQQPCLLASGVLLVIIFSCSAT